MLPKEHVLLSFLQYLNVSFTRKYLDNVISGLAGNNSLSAISDVLNNHYNVENVCLIIDKDDIHKLDSPFLAQLELPFLPIVIINHVQDDKVSFTYKNKKYNEPLRKFLEKWNGAVLLAEPTKESRELYYRQNLIHHISDKIRVPFFICLCLLLLIKYSNISSVYNLITSNWTNGFLLMLYAFGLATSFLLLIHHITESGSFVERVCKGNVKQDCSKILKSSAANFLGLISWSEIGFFYFLSSFISFLLIDGSKGPLFLLSACALPYTFWSIYYQWKIARQWCLFCLTIQATFWMIFAAYLLDNQLQLFSVENSSILQIMTCFTLVASSLWLILPYAKSYYKLKQMNSDYRSFKFNPAIINSSLELTNYVETTAASNIVFGTPDSEISIAIVTDVYCPHCIEAHKYIKELLKVYGDQISCQIIFAIPEYIETAGELYNHIASEKREIIKGLIGIYLNNEKDTSEIIFNQWFEKGKDNYKKFLKEYKSFEQGNLVEEEFNKQLIWFNQQEQTGTPAFFINNRRLPVWYNPHELVNIVTSLIT